MEVKYDLTDPYQIAKYIKEAKKSTPVKLYMQGDISKCSSDSLEIYGNGDFHIILVKVIEF